MNRVQPLLLNTDWMAVSLKLLTKVGEAPSGHTWRVYENGTNIWKMRRILYTDRGDKVLTLLSEPKSRIIDPRAALLEIENEWLYHGIGVRGIQRLLQKSVLFSISGISRLDMAVDFNPTPQQFEAIEHLARLEYKVKGKRNIVPWWSSNNSEWMPESMRGKFIPHQLTWGHKTTSMKWKCYYKSKELKDAVGGIGWDKPYIVDCWRDAQLDENNVWRLEVSIHDCNQLLWNGEPVTQEVWGNHTVELMKDLYRSRFVVRKDEGHADKSNDKVVEFLPINGIRRIKCKQGSGLAEHNGRISLLRRLVQSLDDEQVLLDRESREDVLEHIRRMVRRDGLDHYFAAMVGSEYKEFVEKVRRDAGEKETASGRYDILRMHEWNKDIKPNKNFEL